MKKVDFDMNKVIDDTLNKIEHDIISLQATKNVYVGLKEFIKTEGIKFYKEEDLDKKEDKKEDKE